MNTSPFTTIIVVAFVTSAIIACVSYLVNLNKPESVLLLEECGQRFNDAERQSCVNKVLELRCLQP